MTAPAASPQYFSILLAHGFPPNRAQAYSRGVLGFDVRALMVALSAGLFSRFTAG